MKPITPDEVAQIGYRLYGRRHWTARLSEALGVDPSTIWRWSRGKLGLSSTSARLLRELDAQHRARKAAEKAFR